MTVLEWRPMAITDRENIMDYIARDNPLAAIALDDDFETKAEQARLRPTLYKVGRVKGTREIVVRSNYVMIYSFEKKHNTVSVLRVLHATQQWPDGL